MRSNEPEPLSDEEANDLAVRTVRAIRAERRGAAWGVQKVADYLGYSPQHVRRLMAAGELEGERYANSAACAVPVRSMIAFEDRRYAARAKADRFSRELDTRGVPLE